MVKTTWKEFNKNSLTHSGAHYLMAIHEIYEEQGYARLSDVAQRLKISKGSLSTSLKPLIKKKFILEDHNKHFSLSKTGIQLASKIEKTCATLRHFLSNILGVNEGISSIDACKIEHLLSIESSDKILNLVKALEASPLLLKEIRKEMKKHEICSIKGCKGCEDHKFCLNSQRHS